MDRFGNTELADNLGHCCCRPIFEFAFEPCKETFDNRVVPAVIFTTHAADHTVAFVEPLDRVACILHAAIGASKDGAPRAAAVDGHLQGIALAVLVMAGSSATSPPDHLDFSRASMNRQIAPRNPDCESPAIAGKRFNLSTMQGKNDAFVESRIGDVDLPARSVHDEIHRIVRTS
jgi:hypothetical protein